MLCYRLRSRSASVSQSLKPPVLTIGYPATLLLEFQIPPYMSRWAPFLFSFLGRGICELGVKLVGIEKKV